MNLKFYAYQETSKFILHWHKSQFFMVWSSLEPIGGFLMKGSEKDKGKSIEEDEEVSSYYISLGILDYRYGHAWVCIKKCMLHILTRDPVVIEN